MWGSNNLPLLKQEKNERSRRKNIKARSIVDTDEEILAPVDFIMRGGRKERIDVSEDTFDRKFLNQAVIFVKLLPFSGKVSDLKLDICW